MIDVSNRICDDKIIFFFEGGYNLDVLKYGVVNSIQALLGIENFDDPIGKTLDQEPNVTKLIMELKVIHNL